MNRYRYSHWLSGSLFLLCLATVSSAQAQIVGDTTIPNPSVVTPNGITDIITGGTQVQTNLFHSFQQFSIPTDHTASFQHNSGIANIISRVTGSSASNIDGLIEVLENNGNPSSANFFFINPSGIIFGSNASLNVGGSFVASSASTIKFADNTEFSATNPNPPPSLLNVNVPLGLQFGATSGSIVNRSQAGLIVSPERTLALVGGEVDLEGGVIVAPDGRIELGSVANPGLASLTPTATGFVLGYEGIQNFEDIRLSKFALVDVSGQAGGDVAIAAKRLSVQDGSEITSLAFVKGRGGTLSVNATDAIELTGTSDDGNFFSGLWSEVREGAEGIGGNLVISTRKLIVRDGARIFSNTQGEGRGGDISVNASESIELSGISIIGNASNIFASTMGSGKGGDLTITTRRLLAQQGAQVLSLTQGAGQGGNLTVTAHDAVTAIGTSLSGIENSEIKNSDIENIRISGLLTQSSPLDEKAPLYGYGDAGQLKIETNQLRVFDGAQINTVTFTDGRAGDMLIRSSIIELAGVAVSADGQVLIGKRNLPIAASGLLASANIDSTGNGGNLTVETQKLRMRDGAVIQTSTLGSGDAGNLDIKASDFIEVIGTTKGELYPSSIQALSGGLPDLGVGFPEATGKGGTLSITTGNLSVRDGAQIAVSSLNPTSQAKGAGNLQIQAKNIFLNNRGKLNAATASGSGGSMNLQSQNLLLRRNSEISTTAGTAGAGGDGGNIDIDTKFLIAVPDENSDITANAFEGTGGKVKINATGVFGMVPRSREELARLLGTTDPTQLDPSQLSTNDITAISQTNPALSGVVEINAPEVDPNRGLVELPSQPVNVEVAQGCQAGVRQASLEFFNTGRGGIAPNPYEPLSSSNIWEDVPLPKNASAATSPTRIVEAQGWIVDDKGAVTLVAAMPSSGSQASCSWRSQN
ncbi:filamentous hemagglutinin [Cyanosarcina cf. burmensis CCALA 770]|nr:filamentous hemagglutinin [Cyanosarcina cf. burmensis CCALA 770]